MRAGGSGRPTGRVAIGVGVAALALALAGCGGGGGDPTAKGQAEANTATTPAPKAGKPKAATAAAACSRQVGEFVGGLAALRSNLVAGLDYEGYVDEVQRIQRSYKAIPVDALSLSCLRAAGTPSEKALNRYIAAGNVWTDCVESSGCEAATIEAELQAKWRQASRYLSKAQRGLRQPSAG